MHWANIIIVLFFVMTLIILTWRVAVAATTATIDALDVERVARGGGCNLFVINENELLRLFNEKIVNYVWKDGIIYQIDIQPGNIISRKQVGNQIIPGIRDEVALGFMIW
jgi:hypothetical protein